MASPEIVMGSSLLALFVAAGFGGQLGFGTILIAHIMFCLSFVVVTVRARLAGLDNNLEQAAMDLYATEAQTFGGSPSRWSSPASSVRRCCRSRCPSTTSSSPTSTPATRPRSRCTSGAWPSAACPMQVNVVGTLMFVISIVIVVGAELNRRRQEKALA